MNFNIYLNKETAKKVTDIAKALHRSRNSIIAEALEMWLEKNNSEWEEDFFDFKPIEDTPDFASFRQELTKHINEDPLK